MIRILKLLFSLIPDALCSRQTLLLEILALRQQVAVLKAKNPKPRLHLADRAFWIALRHFWSGWEQRLVLVRPETVVRWHQIGFKFYWNWLTRKRISLGRKATNREQRELIFRMVVENRTWGAPRIQGELKMLGFNISERTVLRWMRKAPRDSGPANRWKAFLNNHREVIAAMDFFTVPTLSFGILHCFFVISHDRRRILHFNVTKRPDSAWVSQQLREAFPYAFAQKYLVFDRAQNFGTEVISSTIKGFGMTPKRTTFLSPWQNGVAERWVGNCRRELLDHVIVLNERHLKRLMVDYIRYYHEDRTHLGLEKQTPHGRIAARDSAAHSKIIALPRLGGLHHRYDLAA